MHLTFEQSETDNKGAYTINKIGNDLDLTQAFPSMQGKQKGNNPQPKLRKQGVVSKKQQNPICPNENKVNYGEPRIKNPVRKFYNKNQIRQVTFKDKKDKKDQNKPVKMLDESIANRKALGFTGSGM